jgi:hypothetical protein
VAKAVESRQDLSVVLVRARLPENVTDMDDVSEVVRVDRTKNEAKLDRLPRVIRRVTEDGE